MKNSRVILRQNEAAERLGITSATLLKWVNAGYIRPVKVDGMGGVARWFRVEDVANFGKAHPDVEARVEAAVRQELDGGRG